MIFQLRHLLLALLLHVLLFGLLAGGAQCSRKVTAPAVIQATLVTPGKPVDARAQQDEQRRRELERQRREQEARRKVEDQKQAEQKRLEDQKRAQEEKRKQSEFAEKKKKEEEAERKRLEEEARRREQAEQERKRREQQRAEALERELQEETMRRALEREEQARTQAEIDAKVAAWQVQLQNHISKFWTRPPGTTQSAQSTVRVQLLPDGTVVSAKIARGSGNPALDRSVEDAVFRSSPLPLPADPSAFDRDLIITFVPAE